VNENYHKDYFAKNKNKFILWRKEYENKYKKISFKLNTTGDRFAVALINASPRITNTT